MFENHKLEIKTAFLSETFIKMFLLKSCSQNEQVVFENHKLEIKKVFFSKKLLLKCFCQRIVPKMNKLGVSKAQTGNKERCLSETLF